MTALSINLNKIALLRNSRDTQYPDPLYFGERCIELGAQGLTVHPRPDQRHIRPEDVQRLALLTQSHAAIEYNIEGNPFATANDTGYPGFLELVMAARPDQVTLVPDSDNQLTSDHGFDLKQSGDQLQRITEQFQAEGIRVSLFMDPDSEQIQLAAELGVERIELYTGPYSLAFGKTEQPTHTDTFDSVHGRYSAAAKTAQQQGLGVNAGHDLNLHNLASFCEIPDILEVSIGHAFTVDALLMGIEAATRAYLDILAPPR